MRITLDVKIDLDTKKLDDKVKKAAREGLRDTISDIAQDAIAGSPWLTGNNRRSIKYEVSGYALGEGVVTPNGLEAATYSTSGYGGYLETGTSRMGARPYFKPALDKHQGELAGNIRDRLEKI